MKELKPGDSTTYTVDGKILVVEPIPFGKLKKIIQIIARVSKAFDKKAIEEDLLNIVPKLVEEYVGEIVPLLFDLKKHPFLTPEWVDDNLTVPTMKAIVVDAITINSLDHFFYKTVRPAPTVAKERELGETNPTPSASTGSTTSSDSPTVGGPKT